MYQDLEGLTRMWELLGGCLTCEELSGVCSQEKRGSVVVGLPYGQQNKLNLIHKMLLT